MAYLRDRTQELTGYQAGEALYEKIDLQCDFVMAYRVDDSIVQRIESFRDGGYVVHMMTGIAWGPYEDYLYGRWDSKNHWDEAQTDREGNIILHGKDKPYMVPTITFADYLTEKLKAVVDTGVVAIHVEEPEFWDRAGYSEAFKREYLLYYGEQWRPPHSDIDARYKSSRLKAYLYKRTIDRVSAALKEYALTKYGRVLRFYVPTHSLLNYTQWKIMSPEGQLATAPYVDGFIAQVWTGTSREKNVFNGVMKERTFETAYLEYGVMQELIKCTGKRMWFSHDPIEDNPSFDWDDYRLNYLKTVTASLLHPLINRYEITPWPSRVFDGRYPKGSPDAEPIPAEYSSLLNGIFQTMGDMECAQPSGGLSIGVLISDTALYQRDYPDNILKPERVRTGTVLTEDEGLVMRFENELFKGGGDSELELKFIKSNAFPSFYGMSLPLLKYGVPVRPVLLDNVNRFAGYLDDCDVLILSYEFMKPDYPNINNAIAAWVKNGGTLIYMGDASDPYHGVDSWWKGKYNNPAEHLFEMLGIESSGEKCVFRVAKGCVGIWNIHPSKLCYSKDICDEYRAFFLSVISEKGRKPSFCNNIVQRRGTYIAAAVFDESVSDEPLVLRGLFADMYTCDCEIITEKTILPGENALLYDLALIDDERLRIIGTSVRITDLRYEDDKIFIKAHGASDFSAKIRLRVPEKMENARAVTAHTGALAISAKYDEKSRSVLLTFNGTASDTEIILS